MKLVSIILPVYNTAEYIDICIQSIFEQTYQNIEVILIDNGSDHSCKQILQQHANRDDRIRLFSLSENMGVGYARNYGIMQATGGYVYFLDSDDYLPEETIRLLVENIGSFPLITGSEKSTYLSTSFTVAFRGLLQPHTYTEERFSLIKDNSALNWLMKREFVQAHGLTFSEDTNLYSDLKFMIPALLQVEQVPYIKQAIYFKRLRNDPIHHPALSQIEMPVKIKEFVQTYHLCKDRYNEHIIQQFLDVQLLNFYRKEIIAYFKNSTKIDAEFDILVKAFQRVGSETISAYDRILKREIKSFHRGKLRSYKHLNRFHQLLRALREGMKSRRKFYQFLYQYVFIKLPRKKRLVFFESFLGKNYSDSPKYIYEHLLQSKEKYQFVWSVNEPSLSIPGNAKQVQRFSLKYFYFIARASYWVSNSRLPKYLDKPKGTTYLQTWHGTPLKKLVFDMDNIYSADPKYKENFYEQSRRWDYLSSPNDYSSTIFKRAFHYHKQLLEFGYPRNDVLYQNNNPKHISQLKETLKIPKDKKAILYAPTWRDNDFIAKGKYSFQLQLDLKKMQKVLGSEYVILLRMHYFIANQIDLTEFNGFAYNFSHYDDIAELYLIADTLITDYSSVFFDYANLKRPILFYTYDLENYRDELRGFYLDIEKELPGPLLKSTDDIIDALKNIEKVKMDFSERYGLFYDRFCKWDDGHAAEMTVKAVFSNDGRR